MTIAAEASHARDIERERASRNARLRDPDGWLTLVGLDWLAQGANPFGSDPANPVVLPDPGAPRQAGIFRLDGDRVEVEAIGGATVLLDGRRVTDPLPIVVDDAGQPSLIEVGRLRLTVIRRAGRTGIRTRDPASPVLTSFQGVRAFPTSLQWRLEGRVERYDPPRQVLVPTILGDVEPDEVAIAVAFDVEGETYRLDAFDLPDGNLEIMFADATNGTETYAAGRFLTTGPPDGDRVVLDFNRSYEPPCVFTPYATCPLPLPQNRLPIRVEAGEISAHGSLAEGHVLAGNHRTGRVAQPDGHVGHPADG
jgi:uncharacterized protein